MKIVVTNESSKDLRLFYYDIEYTVGDKHGKDDLYFYASFRREDSTTLQKYFEILPEVAGRGRYLGSSLGVQAIVSCMGINGGGKEGSKCIWMEIENGPRS
jgi:hypothetical protein